MPIASTENLAEAGNILQSGRNALEQEAQALLETALKLGNEFTAAVETMLSATGKVVITGLGKSGHVSRKIAATLASTGTPSFYLHPAEALHGDLGMMQRQDVLMAIAFGGETEEVNAVVRHAKRVGVPIVAITGNMKSSLAQLADIVLDGSVKREVCPHNLAPTTSTTVALALGDAVAVAIMEARGFGAADFARLHPSGALGRKLATVHDLMKPAGPALPAVPADASFHEVLEAVTRKNYGIVPVVDNSGKLMGAISDGDIRRALLAQGSEAIKMSAIQMMTKSPRTINAHCLAMEAFKLMEDAQITSLFVVSEPRPDHLEGLLRMHDLLAAKIV
jgi:arabinose-5-phosphate isomerase